MEVNDAAEVRTHGGERNAAPGAADEVRLLLCDATNVILLRFTVTVDVEDQKRRSVEVVFRPHDGFQEVLNGVQCLPVPADEAARMGGDDIDAPEISFLHRENIRVRHVEEMENLAECVLEEESVHRKESSRIPSEKSPRLGGLLSRHVTPLPNGVLERLASLKGGDLHRRDLNLLGWVPGVHAGARLALRNAERAEPRDRHGVAALQLLRHGGGQCLEGGGGRTLRHAGSIRDDPDEILLGQGHRMKGEEIRRDGGSVQKQWASASQKRV